MRKTKDIRGTSKNNTKKVVILLLAKYGAKDARIKSYVLRLAGLAAAVWWAKLDRGSEELAEDNVRDFDWGRVGRWSPLGTKLIRRACGVAVLLDEIDVDDDEND